MYQYSFASYSYGCKILQPYVAVTVWMHSDPVFPSIDASGMKTSIKNQYSSTNSGFFINNCRLGRTRRIHVNQSLRLVHMYPSTESGRRESGPFVIDYFFIRRAPVEDNTASERNRTVAVKYCCKILQPYEYDANVYGYDAIFE